MKFGLIKGLLLLIGFQAAGQQLPAIGGWRDHLPLQQVVSLGYDAGTVTAAARNGIFTYNTEKKEFGRLSKSNGLSEVSIKTVAFSPIKTQSLIIYENGNIDLVSGEKVINIPDVYISRNSAAKRINHVLWDGKTAYLSSDLGIIVLDTERRLILATYHPSSDGREIKVWQTAIHDNSLFAATEVGLWQCTLNAALLPDFRNWKQVNVASAKLPPSAIASSNKQLFALRQDSVFVFSGSIWSLFHASSTPVTFLQGERNELFIGEALNGKGVILQFVANQAQPNLIQGAFLSSPVSCIANGNEYWVGDQVNGLIRIAGNNSQQILPDAPFIIPKGYLHFSGGKLLAPAGFVSDAGVPEQLPGAIEVFEEDQWKNFNRSFNRTMDSFPDIMSAIVDQATGKIIAGSFGGGIVEIDAEGKTTIYKQGSALSPIVGNPSDYRVVGLAFDLDRQLWVTNPGTQQPLLVRKKDGAWKKFTIPFPGAAHPGLITVDMDNRKWIILQGGGGLVCFDDRRTPDQTNDDQWRLFRQGRGNGNLPSSIVTAISADKNGFIWVGTDRGVAIIQCSDDLFNVAACEATLPVVRQDNFAGLLLAEEKISDIETDQADRKWITSNNGVWLISADGQKTIHRFTSSNSKLLSDQVLSVAINDQTGEVFFLTSAGISSFRGESTAPVSKKRKPFVFPNPVPPGFSGTIAFRDLPDRAWVKITELNGKLIFETRSLGGQAVWNGKNLQGNRVNSGVYLVYVSEELNQYQVAGKIVFIK